MFLLIDSSTPMFHLSLIINGKRHDHNWEAGRELARYIHGYIEDRLHEEGKTWQDIKGIGIFRGPGSYTGLRIGITVANTLAQSLHIPIVGVVGDGWREQAIALLEAGATNQIVLPEYGGEAHITTPKK